MGNSSICCQDETNSFNITDVDFKQISQKSSKKMLVNSNDIQTQIEESPQFSKEQIFQVHQMLRKHKDKIQNNFKEDLRNESHNQDDNSPKFAIKSYQISSLPYLQSLASSHGINSKNCSPRDFRPELREHNSLGSTSRKQNLKKQVFFNNQDDFLNYTRQDCSTPKINSKCEIYPEYDNLTTRTDDLRFSDQQVSIKLNDFAFNGNTYNKKKDRSQFYKPKITIPKNDNLCANSSNNQSKRLFSDSDLNDLDENQSFSEIDSLDSSYNKNASSKDLTLSHLQDDHDINLICNNKQLYQQSQSDLESIIPDKIDQHSNQNPDHTLGYQNSHSKLPQNLVDQALNQSLQHGKVKKECVQNNYETQVLAGYRDAQNQNKQYLIIPDQIQFDTFLDQEDLNVQTYSYPKLIEPLQQD